MLSKVLHTAALILIVGLEPNPYAIDMGVSLLLVPTPGRRIKILVFGPFCFLLVPLALFGVRRFDIECFEIDPIKI